MVYQNKKATVSFDLDEKFVLGCDEENYDIVLNPKNIKINEPHDAISIYAKTKKLLKIAIVVRHNKDVVFSGLLYENNFIVTYDKDALTIDVETGELINYEKDAVQEEYDFSELDELKEFL